jgi:hypothetical protein
MKGKPILISFLLILVGIISCRKPIVLPNQSLSNIYGEWEWIELRDTNQIVIKSPSTVGYTKQISFSEKGIHKIFRDNKRIDKHSYQIIETDEFYHSNKLYLLEFDKDKLWHSKLKVPLNFYFISIDTLLIFDADEWGAFNLYVKK